MDKIEVMTKLDKDECIIAIVATILKELAKAEKKHPHYPDDMFVQLAIMQEEAGEVTKAVLHYHSKMVPFDDIEKELIQTAAMCIRMLYHNSPWI